MLIKKHTPKAVTNACFLGFSEKTTLNTEIENNPLPLYKEKQISSDEV